MAVFFRGECEIHSAVEHFEIRASDYVVSVVDADMHGVGKLRACSVLVFFISPRGVNGTLAALAVIKIREFDSFAPVSVDGTVLREPAR